MELKCRSRLLETFCPGSRYWLHIRPHLFALLSEEYVKYTGFHHVNFLRFVFFADDLKTDKVLRLQVFEVCGPIGEWKLPLRPEMQELYTGKTVDQNAIRPQVRLCM